MKIIVEEQEATPDMHAHIRVYRDDELVLVTAMPSRVADIVHDMLENDGKLTLIPEPSQGVQIGNNNVQNNQF